MTGKAVEESAEGPLAQWHERSQTRAHSKKPAEGIVALNALLARDDLAPGCRAHALRTRGLLHGALQDTSSAIADIEEAVRLDPANGYNYHYFAVELVRANRLEEALVRARQAAALDPGIQAGVADVAEMLGLWDEALRARSEVVARNPNQSTLASYAWTLLRAGRMTDAVVMAEKAAQQPETALGSYGLACVWALTGDRRRALGLLERSLDLGATLALLQDNAKLQEVFAGDPEFDAILKRARYSSPRP